MTHFSWLFHTSKGIHPSYHFSVYYFINTCASCTNSIRSSVRTVTRGHDERTSMLALCQNLSSVLFNGLSHLMLMKLNYSSIIIPVL